MKLTLDINLQECSRPQVRRFVQKFGKQFPELSDRCKYDVTRTFDRKDHYFGELPYSKMGEERESVYLCYALQMQGLDFEDAMDQSDPECRVWLR